MRFGDSQKLSVRGSVPTSALVLSGLANSLVGNFSLIRFRKGQTLWSTERHFDRRSTLTPEISLLAKSCQNPTFSFHSS